MRIRHHEVNDYHWGQWPSLRSMTIIEANDHHWGQWPSLRPMTIIEANDHHWGQWQSSFFAKILLHLPLFPGRLENLVLQILEITHHFQKCLTDYDMGARALQKIWETTKSCAQLSLLFQVENGLYGKIENIEYLWHCATNFLHSFTMF